MSLSPWDQLQALHRVQRELAVAREAIQTARSNIRAASSATSHFDNAVLLALDSLEKAARAAIEAAVKRNSDI